jgi:hypothetical protein
VSEERLFLLVEVPRGALQAMEPRSTISRVALLETLNPPAIQWSEVTVSFQPTANGLLMCLEECCDPLLSPPEVTFSSWPTGPL